MDFDRAAGIDSGGVSQVLRPIVDEGKKIYELTTFKFRNYFVTETLTTLRVELTSPPSFLLSKTVYNRLMECVLFSTCINGS